MDSHLQIKEYLNNLINEDFKLSQNSVAFSLNLKYKKKSLKKRYITDKFVPEKTKIISAEKKLIHYIPRKYVTFEEGLSFHTDWLAYFRDLIDLKRFANSQNNLNLPSDCIQSCLFKMCFVGAYIKITHSINPSLIGIEGIILMEFLNTFKIVDKKNLMKTIPKKNSVFEFQTETIKFRIYGSHICMRQIDRMVKKSKALQLINYSKVVQN